ncbi:hypothetical protein HDU92_001777 [Lobulomyces angularis]|nr:hypothetical protein HDU92_001777 [Lobulomyces angularis]
MNSSDPITKDRAVQEIWHQINLGWEVTKLLEIVIIPYGYYMLRPNVLCKILLYSAIIAIFHNIFSFVAFYLQVLYPTIETKMVWLMQAISAAIMRILELVVNFKIVNGLNSKQQVFNKSLLVVTVLSAIGVLGGRIYDVLYFQILEASEIRLGMALVSISGLLQAIVCLFHIVKTLRQLDRKHSKVFCILQLQAMRSVFIQFIDLDIMFSKLTAYKKEDFQNEFSGPVADTGASGVNAIKTKSFGD